MNKIETDVRDILIEIKGINGKLDNAVTMDDVKDEITGQISHAVVSCKLEQKNNTKKISMRDVVFALGVIGAVSPNFF